MDDSSLNSVYTIHASDGGDVQRITSNPGGFDASGDYSPDGECRVKGSAGRMVSALAADHLMVTCRDA